MLRILVADDSEVVRQLVKAALCGPNGWSVCEEAADGQQAVLQTRQSKPDLIVMDLAMPLLDGLHAASEILKFAASLPIILYTLHKTPEIELEAKKAGLRAVVSKADDIKALLDAVKQFAPKASASPITAISEELFKPAITQQASEAASIAAVGQSADDAASGSSAGAAAAGATTAPAKVEVAETIPAVDTETPSTKLPGGNSGS